MANSDVLVRLQANTKNYDANIAKARRQLDQFKKDNLSLGGVLKQSTSALTGMAAQFMGVYAAINATKKVLGDMVRINKQFEQGTANLASIMGKTTDEVAALTSQAKQLGATTRYTAMQITELQTNLARLGFTQQEILNSTTAVQAFATATGADLGEAANLAGAALRGFGLNATEMERVASVMAVSTTKSALSFEKLATAVPIVAPVAKQFGFTIEDTITLLGKLSDAGMDASTAATATRNIFLKMADSGGKLSQAMGHPVHSVEEFGEALKEMREKGMSLNDILNMVGVRSTAAFAVFADNADTLKDFKASITDCSDAMHDMESKQLNTLQGSITILNSAWEGLMLTFSESNGVIKTVVDSLTDLLGAWTKWRQRNAGGDTAIKSYQLYGNGLDNEAKQGMQDIVKGYKAGGSTDEQIVAQFTKEKEAIEKERDAARQLYDQLSELDKLKGKQHDVAQTEWNKQFAKMFKNEKYGYNLQTDGAAPDYILRQIAKMEDEIAKKDYGVDLLTTPEPGKQTAAEGGDDQEDKTKGFLAKRRAQIEAAMQKEIADLDKVNMIKEGKEAEYEDKVFKIKRAALEQIAQLYQEDTTERARADAAIESLKIQYQGIQMRLANKGSKGSKQSDTPEVGSVADWEQQAANVREYMKGATSPEEYKELQQDLDFILSKIKEIQGAAEVAFAPGSLNDLNQQLSEAQSILASLAPNTEEWANALQDVADKQAAVNALQEQINEKGGAGVNNAKNTDDAWQNAVAAVNNVGSALQQIEDPAAKVAGIVMQAVANIALGFAQAVASPATGAAGVFGWIAAATAGLATMVSTIAAVKSATSGSYASGGIIPGNSYSGDNLTANVNSGELILNRAQQDSVAAQLQGNNPMGNLRLSTEISGQNLRIVLNNDNRARGGSRTFYSELH